MAKQTTRLECTNCDEIATIITDGLVLAEYCPFCGAQVEIVSETDDDRDDDVFREDDDDY